MSALIAWTDAGWVPVPGVGGITITGPEPVDLPALPLRVVHHSPGIPIPDWLREDLGLPPAPPEPTPIERALDILAPHLAEQPLYHA